MALHEILEMRGFSMALLPVFMFAREILYKHANSVTVCGGIYIYIHSYIYMIYPKNGYFTPNTPVTHLLRIHFVCQALGFKQSASGRARGLREFQPTMETKAEKK